jgi:hypothetical protein
MIDDQVTSARGWLSDHLYRQLPLRRLKRLATAAHYHRDRAILARAIKCVGKPQVAGWAGVARGHG